MDGSAMLNWLLVPQLQNQLALSRMQRAAKSSLPEGKGSRHQNSSVLQGEVSQGLDLALPGYAQLLSSSWASNTLWLSRCPGSQSGHRESAQQRPHGSGPYAKLDPSSEPPAWVGRSELEEGVRRDLHHAHQGSTPCAANQGDLNNSNIPAPPIKSEAWGGTRLGDCHVNQDREPSAQL